MEQLGKFDRARTIKEIMNEECDLIKKTIIDGLTKTDPDKFFIEIMKLRMSAMKTGKCSAQKMRTIVAYYGLVKIMQDYVKENKNKPIAKKLRQLTL